MDQFSEAARPAAATWARLWDVKPASSTWTKAATLRFQQLVGGGVAGAGHVTVLGHVVDTGVGNVNGKTHVALYCQEVEEEGPGQVAKLPQDVGSTHLDPPPSLRGGGAMEGLKGNIADILVREKLALRRGSTSAQGASAASAKIFQADELPSILGAMAKGLNEHRPTQTVSLNNSEKNMFQKLETQYQNLTDSFENLNPSNIDEVLAMQRKFATQMIALATAKFPEVFYEEQVVVEEAEVDSGIEEGKSSDVLDF